MAPKQQKKNGKQRIMLNYGMIIVCILLFAALIVRALVDNTIITAPKWNERVEREMERLDTIQPDRGDILAADGSILATNMKLYTIRVDFNGTNFDDVAFVRALPALADSLAKYYKKRDRDSWEEYLRNAIKREKGKRPSALPLVHKAGLSDLELMTKTFPFFKEGGRYKTGLYGEPIEIRNNPYGEMARRSIGRVGVSDTQKLRYGKSGLERALDSMLRGTPGFSRRKVNISGIGKGVAIPPKRGYDITTTIDLKMQDIVENRLNMMLEHIQSEWGVCVVMEVGSGEIKAISNLERSSSGKYIEGMNRAVQRFEPGSVVKLLSMMIAIDNGVVTNLNQVYATGSPWTYHRHRIRDSHASASKTVRQIFYESSNIGMARIITTAWENAPWKYYQAVKRCGFLEPLNIGIAGERTPRIDSLARADGNSQSKLASMAYGYSTMLPPICTLALYNAVANDGKYVRPKLVKGMSSEGFDTIFPVSYVRDSICSRRTARILQGLLKDVVHTKGGTGYRALHDCVVPLAGKTGTCNVYDPVKGYVAGHSRLAFCGYFPADNPKYSCIVLVSPPQQNIFNAPGTSGRVLRSIAEDFYARGYLGNSSDYRTEVKADRQRAPLMFASLSKDRSARVYKRYGVEDKIHQLRQPSANGGVPSVVGYGIRDAIEILERAGYNVDFRGGGCVVSQNPGSGAHEPQGTTVTLELTQ